MKYLYDVEIVKMNLCDVIITFFSTLSPPHYTTVGLAFGQFKIQTQLGKNAVMCCDVCPSFLTIVVMLRYLALSVPRNASSLFVSFH